MNNVRVVTFDERFSKITSCVYDCENKFVRIMRICFLDTLIEQLFPSFPKIDDRLHNDCNDVFSLSYCNKKIKSMMEDKLIKLIVFPFSLLESWNPEKITKVRRVFLNNGYLMDNTQIQIRKTITSCILKNITYLTNYYCSQQQQSKKFPLFTNLTHLTFGKYFNQPINEFTIPFERALREGVPSKLKYLEFGEQFNQPLTVNVLPITLTHLVFGDNFNQTLNIGILPLNLSHLVFGKCFNQKITEGMLPANLKKLVFGHDFHHLFLERELPKNLTHLSFGQNNDLWIDDFDSYYNSRFDKNVLPINLKYLYLGDYFNQALSENTFPSNLTYLQFGRSFNKPINKNVLPPNLTHLVFGYNFNKPWDRYMLPQSLLHLQFGLPCDSNFSYKKKRNYLSEFNQQFKKNDLPPNLLKLVLGHHFNQLIYPGVLPSKLTDLTFGSSFDQPLDLDVLPTNLIHLDLGYKFNRTLPKNILPSNLLELVFSHCFNQPLDMIDFPKKITHLVFGGNFNQPLRYGLLPENLVHLIFDCYFVQQIGIKVLPEKLTHLEFGYDYDNPIQENVLPNSLSTITFHCKNKFTEQDQFINSMKRRNIEIIYTQYT
jgi:hypothetical protein